MATLEAPTYKAYDDPQHSATQLTEDEQFVLTHMMMWGSDGYPIHKLSKGWTWGPIRSIQGPPVIYKTKHEAVESFERYYDMLIDRKAGRL